MSTENSPGNIQNITAGRDAYTTQGGTINVTHGPTPAKRGLGTDTKFLLFILVADVTWFFIGMLSYTGRNTTGDTWRAVIFLFLLALTGAGVRRWIRRRV
ncbi:hypothetical protein AB0K00_42660 [Dactylosporangium sp. NPDC049525]|uniref:hypothetical protein n=1 Tax=Dactylosporangium sp. NPDC049525 TaxID=3154730 RepID=UPI0034488314